MRGKPSSASCRYTSVGLIPAHAGKTFTAEALRRRSPAHPRACGENALGAVSLLAGAGSSPRMRGKLKMRLCSSRNLGLIPAHAGKTSRRRYSPRARRAHPRACGENLYRGARPVASRGSSPRMRGKPPEERTKRCQKRLIPAHAGKTYAIAIRERWIAAHPRACGENMACRFFSR